MLPLQSTCGVPPVSSLTPLVAHGLIAASRLEASHKSFDWAKFHGKQQVIHTEAVVHGCAAVQGI